MIAMQFINVDKIDCGQDNCQNTGHKLFPKAMHGNRQIIYKLNKHGVPELSQFEVAFGHLAALLAHDLTPKQSLVKDGHQNTIGLAIENITYLIQAREFSNTSKAKIFYKYVEKNQSFQPVEVNKDEPCPSTFFNKLPSGFFSLLMKNVKAGKWSVDMASLAGIFGISYFLEEDDLHKGNFGCYVIRKDEKLHFVFFKIDHDMMFSDALMSFGHGRPTHWWRRDAAFTITSRDLKHFPFLHDSVNHYWPTTFSFGAKLNDDRAYHHFKDLDAFRDLGKNKEFQQAKWRAFYRYLLIPSKTVRASLAQSLDVNDPAERAKLNMILHAFVARQARLRSELFTLPEFRAFVSRLDPADFNRTMMPDQPQDHNDFVKEIQRQQALCKRIDVKDTPLHIAIRMGDFRYQDNWVSVYASYIDKKNSRGQRPIDIALQQYTQRPSKLKSHSIRSNPAFAVKFLLHKGARLKDKTQVEEIKQHSFEKDYVANVKGRSSFNSVDDLKKIMQRIDDDSRVALKMKKRLAFSCLMDFIEKNKSDPNLAQMLKAFKTDLNGDSKQGKAPACELQFIRQLRSRLWIIRKLRGLVGGTSTQVDMTRLIDKTLKRLEPESPGCFSFFKRCFKGSAPQNRERPSSLVSLP